MFKSIGSVLLTLFILTIRCKAQVIAGCACDNPCHRNAHGGATRSQCDRMMNNTQPDNAYNYTNSYSSSYNSDSSYPNSAQQQLDAQIRQIEIQSKMQADIGNNLLQGLGSLYNNILAQKASKNIAAENKNRDKKFEELRNRLKNEDGEIIDCMNCTGQGYRTCYSCSSSGKKTCGTCSGRGGETCITCKGAGSYEMSGINFTCASCSGKRVRVCYTCNSTGGEFCNSCNGTGKKQCTFCVGTGKEFRTTQKTNNSSIQYSSSTINESANSYSHSSNAGTNSQSNTQPSFQVSGTTPLSNSSPCSDAERNACMARANAEVKNSPEYKEATSLETYSPKKIALQQVKLGQLTIKYCDLCLTSKDRETILKNISRYQKEADTGE